MTRKIFFIILGALLILALIFVSWFWFFGKHKTATPDNGSLGTSGNSSANGSGSDTGGNGQAPVGGTAGTGAGSQGTNTQTPIGGNTVGSTYTPSNASSTYSTYTTPSGVTWLNGGGSTNRLFTPTPINQLTNVDISGIGNIGGASSGSGGGIGLGGALAGAAISCFVYMIPAPPSPTDLFTVQTGSPNENSKTVQDCLTRVVAKIAIQSITASLVEWINSGFNGQPSFIQDYEKFFTDIADKSAGEFIQGSGLAFLCSPFKLQIKIAIAQSYANRKSSTASSCTLSQVVGNVENFMNGNFAEGGWPGLISFTTEPTNNPYGAFIYAQIKLNDQILADTRKAQSNIKDGFIGSTEEYNCRTVKDPDGGAPHRECQTRIVTPPSIGESLAQKMEGLPIDQNLLADSFDEIISALMNQLITKTLYGGLANLSKNLGVNAQQQRGIDAAQTLLTNLQGASQTAQQYASAEQGSVSDVQAAQTQLNTLSNCWNTAASSTALTTAQIDQAHANAADADASIVNLETRVTLYNSNVTRANAAIASIQQFQSSALAATTLKEVQAVQKQFDTARSSGALIVQDDVTLAQQNRQTLQSEMLGVNQATAAKLTQCYSFGK